MDDTQQALEMNLFSLALTWPEEVMSLCEARDVTEEWFSLKESQAAWPKVVELWKQGILHEVTLVAEALGDGPILAWLQKCWPRMVMKNELPHYVETLAKTRLKRQLSALSSQIRIDTAELDVHEAIKRARGTLDAICEIEQASYSGIKPLSALTGEALAEYQLLYQKRVVEGDKDFFNGLAAPWSVLNRLYAGIKPGIHIIAARPSQGKTAFGLTMCSGMAHKQIPQLFFSLDMGEQKLVERGGSLLGQVSLQKLGWDPSQEDLKQFEAGLNRIPSNIYISSAFRIDRIIGEIHAAVKYRGVKCVWIDYLQIIAGDKDYYKSHKEEVDSVLSQLKQCAYNLKIPIFCLAQLNRESAKNPAARPTLIDIGDSGNVEREAATVILLWKDLYVRQAWDKKPPLKLAKNNAALAACLEPMWILFAKNQQGSTASLPFVLYKNTFLFRPADHDAKPFILYDERGQKVGMDYTPCFSTIRDDYFKFTNNEGTGLDDFLFRAGTLGKRGV